MKVMWCQAPDNVWHAVQTTGFVVCGLRIAGWADGPREKPPLVACGDPICSACSKIALQPAPKTDPINVYGEAHQIPIQTHCATCICGPKEVDKPGDPRFSKFRDAAIKLLSELDGPAWQNEMYKAVEQGRPHAATVSWGDRVNRVEDALASAFRKGQSDG